MEIDGKSVAVVGNAQSLFDYHYGSLIDEHDIVFRFNKAAPIFCDYDVSASHGSKFDYWMFWTVGAFYNRFINTKESSKKIKDKFYSDYPTKIQASINGHKKLTEKFISHTCPVKYFQDIRQEFRKKDSLLQPSAGIVLLNWITHYNPTKVSIFGMDFKSTPTFSEIEKFKVDMKNGVDIRCKHDYNLEREWFETHLSKKVNLY